MKLKLILAALIVSAIAENATEPATGTPRPRSSPALTTPAPNFISSTLENIRKFFFSEFSAQLYYAKAACSCLSRPKALVG